jgi:putative sigma-54 modulation protein
MMTINIQYVKMKTSDSMSLYVTKKLQRIEKKYEWIVRVDVFFKVENDPTEKGYICEMEVSLPGPKIFATSNEKNFEMAVKETINDINKQLKKRKAKFTSQNISS